MEDASLEDFLDVDAGASESEETGVDAGASQSETPDPAEDSPSSPSCEDSSRVTPGEGAPTVDSGTDTGRDAAAEVNPHVGTYEYTPSGAPCAACGAVVDRRWREESGFVCPACKSW